MCLLSYYPPGVPVNEEHLQNGMQPNYEGFGYALTDGDHLVTNRGLDGRAMLAEFLAFRDGYQGGTDNLHGVFHSRLSTGSAVSGSNCHPFDVAGDPDTVVFANGALPYEQRWLDLTGDCDTRVFAEESFPAIFDDLDDPVIFGTLEKWATPGNKLAVVTVNPRYAEPVYIVNRGQWLVTPEGALHSNSDYLGKGTGWDEEVRERDGHLLRWRILQPGQCPVDGNYHPDSTVHIGTPLYIPMHPAFRDETERRAQVAGAPR